MSFRLNAILLCICLLPAAAAAEIYKWVDDDGTVHYGQKPPADARVETVKPPPPVNTEAAQKELREKQERLRELQEQRAEREKSEQESQKEAAARKERCEAAKRALEQMRTQNRLQVVGDDGERRYLTPEEIQEREKKAQELVKENCL